MFCFVCVRANVSMAARIFIIRVHRRILIRGRQRRRDTHFCSPRAPYPPFIFLVYICHAYARHRIVIIEHGKLFVWWPIFGMKLATRRSYNNNTRDDSAMFFLFVRRARFLETCFSKFFLPSENRAWTNTLTLWIIKRKGLDKSSQIVIYIYINLGRKFCKKCKNVCAKFYSYMFCKTCVWCGRWKKCPLRYWQLKHMSRKCEFVYIIKRL